MSDCAVWNGFEVRTQAFARSVFNKPSPPCVLSNALPKGTFDRNIGVTKTIFRFANIEPTSDEPTWSAMATATGTGDASCGQTYTEFEGGWDAETYSPVTLGMKFEILCRTDQYFNYMPELWLQQYMVRLSKLSKRQLDNYLIAQYMRRVPIAVCTMSGFTIQDASATLTAPRANSELTQDMLDVVAQHLIEAGSTEPDDNGWIMLNGSRLWWTLLIGMEASGLILTNNSDFAENIRFAFESKGDASPLLKLVGSDIAIKGFRHHQWLIPARFNYEGGKYVRVNTYVDTAATKGVKPIINPSYTNADFEGALVVSPHVMTQEFIVPQASVGGVTWPANEYGMGDWKFVTGIDAGCTDDPLRKKGRHYAEWNLALAPGALPESGMLILFQRCQNGPTGVSCS